MRRVRFKRDLPDEPISGVFSFLEQISQVCEGEWYFRGHRQDATQRLVPSIGRAFTYAGRTVTFTPAQERNLLQRFRRHAYKHFGRLLSEWEALFLARHHELPVRLLDWSTNPVVALYFASTHEQPEEQGPGAVWAIRRRPTGIEELDVVDHNQSPLRIRGIKLVYPFYPTPRLTEQSGVFTLHEDPWADLDSLGNRPFPAGELDIDRLKKWVIPADLKPTVIAELERLAINTRTLFPDLDGLARGLWQSEVLRSSTALPARRATNDGRPNRGGTARGRNYTRGHIRTRGQGHRDSHRRGGANVRVRTR